MTDLVAENEQLRAQLRATIDRHEREVKALREQVLAETKRADEMARFRLACTDGGRLLTAMLHERATLSVSDAALLAAARGGMEVVAMRWDPSPNIKPDRTHFTLKLAKNVHDDDGHE